MEKMATTKKLESIEIFWAGNIPEEIRKERSLPSEGFIELRVESNSPPMPSFVQLGSVTPGEKFSHLIKQLTEHN